MDKNIGNRKSGLVVRTGVKAGGLFQNHSQKLVVGLRVKAGVRAGGIWGNHNSAPRRA